MAKPVLGIVGGIGSGKSLVAAALVARGGYLIDADHLGHEALRQPDIREQIVHRWGKALLDTDGEVQRRDLGKIVFANLADRQALEALVFPWIERRIGEEIKRGQGDPRYAFIILDAAIMLETGWDTACDKILFVEAPRPLRLDRLRRQRGWSEEELARREASQWPLEEKKGRADAVVANQGDPSFLHERLKMLLGEWGWTCGHGPDPAQ